ncbi:MAG: 4Fe-4S dicluster domain-containing protein [Ruminococcaceae bacterium]|nr:4Fe-4S dicluster domain-containing protein [Oscillospiraceae bacterium]
MISLVVRDRCTGCGACEQSCAVGALKMKEDEEGFLFPVIDEESCVSCNKCVNVCPVASDKAEAKPADVYAVRAKDEDTVFLSSSGGVFGTLAECVVNAGGVVFGAGYDENLCVLHKCATSLQDIGALMGSKYVQSDVRNTYKEIKEYLTEGKQVLFTGTSCQCAGLKSYLEKDYDNLLLVDFVCHGVPSPALFKNYLEFMGQKGEITRVRFRDKTEDKKRGHYISIEYKNAPVYRVPSVSDPYMLAFLQNISLRRCCYECSFKAFKSGSDITIGDFWGLSKTDSPLREKDGVSLCAINTEKGRHFFEKIKDKIDSDPRTLEEALGENRAIITSTKKNPLREKYLMDMHKMNIKKLNDKYCSNSFGAKIRRFIAKA